MRAELDDDNDSTLYEASEEAVPPYADYGDMTNDLGQLPQEFMTSVDKTETTTKEDEQSFIPPTPITEK